MENMENTKMSFSKINQNEIIACVCLIDEQYIVIIKQTLSEKYNVLFFVCYML